VLDLDVVGSDVRQQRFVADPRSAGPTGFTLFVPPLMRKIAAGAHVVHVAGHRDRPRILVLSAPGVLHNDSLQSTPSLF
jgi:hypothetical protein